jgi:hypothetical protein
MNIRIAILVLALAMPSALAQEYKKPVKAPAAERAAMLETMQKGKMIEGSSEQYRHLPEVLAVARGAGETPQQAAERAAGSGAQIVETKGRLVLFRSAQQNAALVKSFSRATVYPTVLNTRTGNLGVLTGTLVVQPKNMADAAAIAAGHGLETVKEYPQIRFVFYRAKAGTDIADVAAALQADPRVETAYPEIVEYVRTPK